MRQLGFFRAGLIGILLAATHVVVVAALLSVLDGGLPAHAQTPKISDAQQKRDAASGAKIKSLEAKLSKSQKELSKLATEMAKTAGKPKGPDAASDFAKKAKEIKEIDSELTLRKDKYGSLRMKIDKATKDLKYIIKKKKNISKNYVNTDSYHKNMDDLNKSIDEQEDILEQQLRIFIERFGRAAFLRLPSAYWMQNQFNLIPQDLLLPSTTKISVQLPEVCVGTTYIVSVEDVLEEGLPLVMEDDEDPRDAPQPEVPVASVPKEEVPGDEPRDVPREETPGVPVKNIPVTLTPEEGDEPRDVPQPGVPITSTPEEGDEPRDVPDEEIDLGLVKAVATVVQLAVINAATGQPVTNAALKVLADEPPLPGTGGSDVAFSADEFFEDDVDGGFSDDDGNLQLASLTFPIGDDATQETPESKEMIRLRAEEKKLVDQSDKHRRAKKKMRGDLRNSEDLQSEELKKKLHDIDVDASIEFDSLIELFKELLATNKSDAVKSPQFKDIDPEIIKKIINAFIPDPGPPQAGLSPEESDRNATRGKLYQLLADEREKLAKRERAWVDEALESEIARDPKKGPEYEEHEKSLKKLDKELAENGKKQAELKKRLAAEKGGNGAPISVLEDSPGPTAIETSSRPSIEVQVESAKPSRQARKLGLPIDAEPRQQLIVGLNNDLPASEAISVAMANPIFSPFVINAFAIGSQPIMVLSAPSSEIPALKNHVEKSNTVSWFEPDPCWRKEEIDDPYFHSSGLWGKDYDDQWAIKRVGVSEEMITDANQRAGAKSTIVAVIDTGLDWYHPDLGQDSIWRNDDEIPGNGIDDDGNGYVDDVIGWNFVNQNNSPWDHDGHGTFVSGVIAAANDNAAGIAGINPHARIMPLKALDSFGQGHASMVAEAITYAANNGARVINLSLGGQGLTRIVKLAVEHAAASGALVVVAAGNSAADVSEYGPAGIDGVITVSATDQRDRRAGFSNWGEEVDISAPGVDVMSLRARNTDLLSYIRDVEYELGAGIVGEGRAYYRASGTSFAAPIVSGAASLIMSLRPEVDPGDVRRMLLNAANDIETPGVDNYTGYGLIDLKAALAADPKFDVESRIKGVEVIQLSGKPVLRLTGTADASEFDSANLLLGKGKEPKKWLAIKKRITEPVQDGVLMDIPAAAFSGAKEWTIRLITKHKDGTERESRFAVTLG